MVILEKVYKFVILNHLELESFCFKYTYFGKKNPK